MKHAYSVVLLPVSGQILTDPGPLCAGETVTLTCDISGRIGSNLLIWSYDGVLVISITPGSTTLPAMVVVSGVQFTVLDTQMDTVSQISFVASVMMSGRTLGCSGNGQTRIVTFQVEPIVGKKYPSHDPHTKLCWHAHALKIVLNNVNMNLAGLDVIQFHHSSL